jgi:hypothetical protein
VEITVAALIRRMLHEVPHLVVAQRDGPVPTVFPAPQNDVDSVRSVASIAENPFARISEYDMRHLLRHLAESGRSTDLHRLLRISHISGGTVANAWFVRRRDRSELGSYIEDLLMAWDIADDAGEHGDALVLQAQYLLMTASVNSLVALLPADQFAVLPSSGTMTPAQAIVLAQRYPDVRQRADALLRLLPQQGGPSLHDAVTAILELITSLPTRSDRWAVMTRLVPHIPGERVPQAIEVARGLPAAERVSMLRQLAPALADSPLEELLAEAISQFRTARSGRRLFDHERNKERDRLEHEATELLQALLTRVAALGRPDRALSLATELLLPPAPDDLVPLFAPRQPDHTDSYVWTIRSMMPYLPLADIRGVIADLERRSPDAHVRRWLVAAWSKRLAESGMHDEAVAVAAGLPDRRLRVETLAGLLEFSSDRRDQVRVVAMIVELCNDRSTGYVDRQLVGDRIAALGGRAGLGTRVRVLAHVLRSPRLAWAVFSARVVDTAPKPARRRRPLCRGDPLHREADEAERAIVQAARESLVDGTVPTGRPGIWRRVGSELIEGYGHVVTAIALTPGDAPDGAPEWSPDDRDLRELLRGPMGLARLLLLPDRVRWGAATRAAAQKLSQHDSMGDAIRAGVVKLLDHAPATDLAGLRSELRAAQRSAEYVDRRRARTQADIIVRLAAIGEVEVALAACRDIDDSGWRGLSLARLAGFLPAHLLDQARELVIALPPLDQQQGHRGADGVGDPRAAALYALARAMNQVGRTVDAVAVADALEDGPIRREAWGELMENVVTVSPPDLARVWRRSLHALGDLPRADVAEDLVAFRPIMVALGGRSTIDAVVQSLDQVLAWWPLSPATLEHSSLSRRPDRSRPARRPGTRGSWRARSARSSRGTA